MASRLQRAAHCSSFSLPLRAEVGEKNCPFPSQRQGASPIPHPYQPSSPTPKCNSNRSSMISFMTIFPATPQVLFGFPDGFLGPQWGEMVTSSNILTSRAMKSMHLMKKQLTSKGRESNSNNDRFSQNKKQKNWGADKFGGLSCKAHGIWSPEGYLQSSPTGPAEHWAGGSLCKSVNSWNTR